MTDTTSTSPDAASPTRRLVERTFRAVEAKNLDGVLACFAAGAEMFDPHYPTPLMVGHAAIADGLRWGFASMERFGFTVTNYFESPDGSSAALEVDSHHVLKVGMKLDFPQAFFVTVRDGTITRLRAYEPYGPNGIGGAVLGLSRLGRLVGKATKAQESRAGQKQE